MKKVGIVVGGGGGAPDDDPDGSSSTNNDIPPDDKVQSNKSKDKSDPSIHFNFKEYMDNHVSISSM